MNEALLIDLLNRRPAMNAGLIEAYAHWNDEVYRVMGALCTDKADAEKEAEDAQIVWPHMGPHRAVQLVEAADVEAMRAGYAAARLEIQSLQARIKTMAEEHADELTVAHLDGRMRAAQVMPESIRSILVRCRNFIDTTKVPAYPAGADLADEIDVLLAAQPAGEYPELPEPDHVMEDWSIGGVLVDYFTTDQMRAFADATHAIRASHGQAPAQAIGPCVICGSDEPFTGTCGSGGDPRALCKQPAPTPQADSVTAPAAGAVAHTLSDAQIEAMPVWRNFVGLWPESRREIVDAVVDLLAAAPTPPTQTADSVLEDAARLDWLLLHISGAEFRRIGVHYSGNARRADVDAARKQGANHD